MRQKSLAVVPRKFPLCSTNSHVTAPAVGLAVLVRSTRSVAQYLVAKKVEVYIPLPGRSRETRPLRFVPHGDDPTSTANRLGSGDLLHLESLKKSRNVVPSDVVRGGFLGQPVEHALRHTSACRLGRGGWHRACSVASKCAGEHPRRECRRVDPNRGVRRPKGIRPGCQQGCRGKL